MTHYVDPSDFRQQDDPRLRALDAAVEATKGRPEWQLFRRPEARAALLQAAIDAASPVIVEAEREQADALALGGMEIEVAVARTFGELGIGYPALEPQMRALRALYRRGVNVGFEIARKYAPPQALLPAIESAVAEAVAAERERIKRLVATWDCGCEWEPCFHMEDGVRTRLCKLIDAGPVPANSTEGERR